MLIPKLDLVLSSGDLGKLIGLAPKLDNLPQQDLKIITLAEEVLVDGLMEIHPQIQRDGLKVEVQELFKTPSEKQFNLEWSPELEPEQL